MPFHERLPGTATSRFHIGRNADFPTGESPSAKESDAMQQTSISTPDLERDAGKASALIAQAMALMAPYLPTITEDERSSIPRARTGFFNALPGLFAATTEHPQLAKTAGFDAAATREDAANVQIIAPLAVQTQELAQRVADAKLTWTGEAVSSSLAVYRVASALVGLQPSLRTIVETLAPLFTNQAKKK